jgi:Trypsin
MKIFKILNLVLLLVHALQMPTASAQGPPTQVNSSDQSQDANEFLEKVVSLTHKKVNDVTYIPQKSQVSSSIAQSIVKIGFHLTTAPAVDAFNRNSKEKYSLNSVVLNCTGTIVSSLLVLTAAHCDSTFRQLVSQAGSEAALSSFGIKYAVQTSRGEIIPILSTIAIPNSSVLNEDTAFLQLARATTLPPIAIAPPNTTLTKDSELIRYGFYFNSFNDGLLQHQFSRWNLELVTAYESLLKWDGGTDSSFKGNQLLEKMVLFPSAKGRITCPGSSGGPTLTRISGQWRIIAVTSGGGSSLQEDCYNNAQYDQAAIGNKALDRAWVENDFQIDRNPNITLQPWVYSTFRQLNRTH